MYLDEPVDDNRNNCSQSTQHFGQSDWNVEAIKIQAHFRYLMFCDVQAKSHVGCDSNNYHQCRVVCSLNLDDTVNLKIIKHPFSLSAREKKILEGHIVLRILLIQMIYI